MKVLYIEPCNHPRVVNISLDGLDFNDLVHGDYDCRCFMPDVKLVTNDTGKLIGMLPNRVIANNIVYGPCFFSGIGTDRRGNLIHADLPDHHIGALTEMFYDPLPLCEFLKYRDLSRKWINHELIKYHNKYYPQFSVRIPPDFK